MIRQALRLAVEAVKVEIRDRRKKPEPPAEPEPEEPPAAKADSRWQSSAFHLQALASEFCPDCGDPKRIGFYRCHACIEVARAS